MSYMPSVAFVAQALYAVGADGEWEDAPSEEQNSHMQLAKVAIGSILSWQAQHKPDGSGRYRIEPIKGEDADGTLEGWAIYDVNVGSHAMLGVIHDPLLAQQIVDDLNRRDAEKKAPRGPMYGD